MSSGPTVRVVAAVLVHEAVESLARVVAAIRAQTLPVCRVVVFDNASRADVRAALGNVPDLTVLRSDENVGVGAGHARAWGEALSDPSVTHVWSLEHDTFPEPDCLAELVRATQQRSAAVYLPRLERNREEALANDPLAKNAPPEQLPRVTFNGILVPRATIAAVGVPASHFFVGGEDAEWSLRLKRQGLTILRILQALALHPTKGNRRYGVRPSVLRSYYSTRNWMYLDILERGGLGRAWCCLWCVGSLPKIVLAEDQKLERVAGRVLATFDALAGRMGRRSYWFLRG